MWCRYGKSESEDRLLADLLTEYANPGVLESASQCRVFSFGGGHRGVQMMQHGVAWLGLVSGAKLWHVGARSAAQSNRVCPLARHVRHPPDPTSAVCMHAPCVHACAVCMQPHLCACLSTA